MTSKYEAVHQEQNGPGDKRPTGTDIINDNDLVGKWKGMSILITGCSSGLGVETARVLHETGADLYLTARNIEKAKQTLGDLAKSNTVHILELDLESLASVRKCASQLLESSPKLNILIANAGVMMTPEGRTKDGFETQFGTNHLAHFLLIQLLIPALITSSSENFQSRVVILSSSAHRHGGVNMSNLDLDGEYNPMIAYAQSKTANIYTATELERRYGSKGVHAWAVHPGIINTSLTRHLSEEMINAWTPSPEMMKAMKSVPQGAATSIWAAVSKDLEGQGGLYLESCQISRPVEHAQPEEYEFGYGAHAFDAEKASQLWEKSLELVSPFLRKS